MARASVLEVSLAEAPSAEAPSVAHSSDFMPSGLTSFHAGLLLPLLPLRPLLPVVMPPLPPLLPLLQVRQPRAQPSLLRPLWP